MKLNIKAKHASLTLLALLMAFIVSCDMEDNTGYSTLKITTPTISITPMSADTISLVETDSVFEYTVTLSVAQSVDIKLNVSQIAGTASTDDYEMSPTIDFPAGSTSAKFKIKIKNDDLSESTETLTIQIGDTQLANASMVPVKYTFKLLNSTSDDLVMNLSWTTDVKDAIGLDLAPDQVVDLRLLLVNSLGTVVETANGTSFESLILSASKYPDGEYLIGADIFETINAGEFNKLVNLSLNLEFNQAGKINKSTFDFPSVMTNEFSCDAYRTYMGKLTKTGTNFEFTKEISFLKPSSVKWYGKDATYKSEVEVVTGCDLLLTGLGFGWMLDWWGETIVDGGTLKYTVDGDGKVTIPLQDYCTTTYKGKEQPIYKISGSGTIDKSGTFPVMNLKYDFIQDGNSIGKIAKEYDWLTDYFEASLSLDSIQDKTVVLRIPRFKK